MVNAQGINNNGLIVGFYFGTDGQDHGFTTQYNASSPPSTLTGTAIADPTIPTNIPGDLGTTFMFSQILGINDRGIAVGYYGDSSGDQHGFLYNTKTGAYTFVDDPSMPSSGLEITQITGINNAGEITGFYEDTNGIAHGFVAGASVPEPSSLLLLGVGLTAAIGLVRRKQYRRPIAEAR